MQSRQIHESDGQRTFVAILETGDEVMACLKTLAKAERLTAAQVSAIGAFSGAVLQYFDWETKAYRDNPVEGQVEVAAMLGDIGTDEQGAVALHVHLVLGKPDGSAVAGHLKTAHVRPTLEVLITESPAHLRRKKDPVSGLNLIRV